MLPRPGDDADRGTWTLASAGVKPTPVAPSSHPDPAAPRREISLTRAWLDEGQKLTDLTDHDGRGVEVIYVGHEWGGPGPDIQDAIVSFDGGPAEHGDIEVHLDPADWTRHGHAGDAAYEGVVLHVTWTDPAEKYAGPPTVAMQGRLPAAPGAATASREPADEMWACREEFGAANPGEALQFLRWQGWQRMVERSSRIESDLAVMSADQVLYAGVMDALGYSQNREPFGQLVRLLPWDDLGGLLEGRGPRTELAEALLFGAAGLLPDQGGKGARSSRVDELRVRGLRRLWAPLSIPAIQRGDWRFHGVRPNNWPTRRLAAAARLFTECLPPPPTVALQRAVLQVAETGSSAPLEDLFRIPLEAEDFWAHRIDFGRPVSARATALVGTDRAREILANVALPLSLTIARRQASARLLEGVRETFALIGSVSPNRSTGYMADITGSAGLRGGRGAAAQQGYLHLYRGWCQRKNCSACPAATFQSRR